MAKPNKLLRHNILIVCEGENTEPQYFSSLIPLAKEAWKNTSELVVEIKPKPKLEEESPVKKQKSKHKTPRKKRQLKAVPIESPIIEDEYKAVPIRYVREAQQGLEDATYEETWAVFDKDYHPKHKESFELAEQEVEGKKVQIAFSSISFEHWILLHFEKNKTAFQKSACKDRKTDKYLNCCTNQHPDDCKGKKCVDGYLRKIQPTWNTSTKKATIEDFTHLHKQLPSAFENAAWLRHQVLKATPAAPIYTLNPYTNLDHLVKYLLQVSENIIWITLGGEKNVGGITILFRREKNASITLRLTNNDKVGYVFLPDHLYLISNGKKVLLAQSKEVIPVSESLSITIKIDDPSSQQVNVLLNSKARYKFILDL